MTSTTTIRRVPYDSPSASTLRAAQQLEIAPLRPRGPGIPASAANVAIFLIAYDEAGQAIGCGGLRALAEQGLPGQGEVKRMYVVPERRGEGPSVAGLVLRALEEEARGEGWGVLKVQTSRLLVRARRFYEKEGFVRCELFGAYCGSEFGVCYEKVLG